MTLSAAGHSAPSFVLFVGSELTARGSLEEVAVAAKQRLEAGALERIACFEDQTGRPRDLDLSGNHEDVQNRYAGPADTEVNAGTPVEHAAAPRGRGRPKLGVVSREISLLPRHWSWLAEQRGGASATLRRLVEVARKQTATESSSELAVEATHRFMWDMAGNLPGFEEASRALFARDFSDFKRRIAAWPAGIREQLERFVDRARTSNR